VNQQRWTKLAVANFFNPVDHFRWKELFTRFTLVDSTALLNLGDPCKRGCREGKNLPSRKELDPGRPSHSLTVVLVMGHITTFRSTTDGIYDGGPLRLLYYIILRHVTSHHVTLYYVLLCYVMLCYVMLCYVTLCYNTIVLHLPTVFSTVTCCTGL
jgi:hypothetical protein